MVQCIGHGTHARTVFTHLADTVHRHSLGRFAAAAPATWPGLFWDLHALLGGMAAPVIAPHVRFVRCASSLQPNHWHALNALMVLVTCMRLLPCASPPPPPRAGSAVLPSVVLCCRLWLGMAMHAVETAQQVAERLALGLHADARLGAAPTRALSGNLYYFERALRLSHVALLSFSSPENTP